MGNSGGKTEDFKKHYTLHQRLGVGSFGTVKKAIRKSDHKEFAVKIIKKSKIPKEELEVIHDEVDIMRRINHPNCVKLYETFNTPKKMYMVMELLTGGELFTRISDQGSFSEMSASILTRTILSAIEYLHAENIVHRDLKPENLIYLDDDEKSPIKITDFGLASHRKSDEKTLMRTACGTPGYVAPEVLKAEPYGPEVDLWSIGVILYILLCGYPPFFSEKYSELFEMIKNGDYEFPNEYGWQHISLSAKDLVRKLLTVEPKKRITSTQALAHPWISGNEATSRKFDSSHTVRLQLLQARATFRKAVRTIIALNRFTLDVPEAKSSGRRR